MADTDAHYRTLYRPAAEQSYKEAFARVPLNIHVLFGDYGRLPGKYEMLNVHGRRAAVFLLIPTDVRPGEYPAEKPGNPNRITPFTPFVLLHRLGDMVRRGQWVEYVTPYGRYDDSDDAADPADPYDSGKALARLTKSLQVAYDGYRPAASPWINTDFLSKVNAGVGTAAGRLNALESVDETWSDLFAKYLLTQRFDFDPEAGTFPKDIRELRRKWAVGAYEHMRNVLARLQEKGAIVDLNV